MCTQVAAAQLICDDSLRLVVILNNEHMQQSLQLLAAKCALESRQLS
jgi:hypothetical protein